MTSPWTNDTPTDIPPDPTRPLRVTEVGWQKRAGPSPLLPRDSVCPMSAPVRTGLSRDNTCLSDSPARTSATCLRQTAYVTDVSGASPTSRGTAAHAMPAASAARSPLGSAAIRVRGPLIRYAQITLSVVFTLVYLLSVGFVALRADAMALGVALGWDNQMVMVTGTASPWFLNMVVAGLSGLLVFWFLHRKTDDERQSVHSAVASLLVLIVWVVGFSATKDYTVGPMSLGGPFEANANPVFMWAQAGALSPATHAVCAVLTVVVAISLSRNKAAQRPA